MSKKGTVIRICSLFLFSIILTFLTANRIGVPIEKIETKLYQKISGKSPQHIQFDSMGVPVVNYEGKLGRQYNTVTIAEQALKLVVNEKDSSSARFDACIEWLTNNYTILNDSSIIYLVHFDWPGYKMTSPWRSAMNQGRAMQAFLKAFDLTNDSIYLCYVRKSMNALNTEVKNGGVTYIDSTGYWFEEYADDDVPQSRVLNGMIVVLQALSDFQKVTNDSLAFFLFGKGVDALKSTLHLYDNNGHSNYDVFGRPASPWYHKFHLEQIDFLYKETEDPVFYEYWHKWSQYKEPSYLTALYRKPRNIGIFAVFTIFITVFSFLFLISYFLWFRRKANFKEP